MFLTGSGKKKHRTAADMIKYYHNPTVHQLNMLHEIASQHLGHPPSLGHEDMPWRFPNVAPETWNYIRSSTRQPVHEYARLMTSGTDASKKASGITSGIVDVLSSAGKTALKYGTKVVQTLIKHQDSIRTGIKVAKDVADFSTLLGSITGVISPDTHASINKVTAAVERTSNRYGKKPDKKPGSGWIDYDPLTAY